MQKSSKQMMEFVEFYCELGKRASIFISKFAGERIPLAEENY